MKKLVKRIYNKNTINKVFPKWEELFSYEETPFVDLGYQKVMVSYFYNWLSREDYTKISEIPLETVFKIKKNFKELFVNYYENSEIYILNFNQTIDLIKNKKHLINIISDIIDSETDTVLFDVSKKNILLGFEDLTSIFYFKTEDELVNFKQCVSEIGLNYFLEN